MHPDNSNLNVIIENEPYIERQLNQNYLKDMEIVDKELGIQARKFLNKKEIGKVRYAQNQMYKMRSRE